jgi:hypothetical protein
MLVTGRVRLEGAGKGREDKGSKVDNDGLWDGVVPRVCWMMFSVDDGVSKEDVVVGL